MSAPTVVPVLDEDTRRELQPPCEAERHPLLNCDRAAEWVARMIGHPSRGPVLLCDEHARILRRLNAKGQPCHCCGRWFQIDLERL